MGPILVQHEPIAGSSDRQQIEEQIEEEIEEGNCKYSRQTDLRLGDPRCHYPMQSSGSMLTSTGCAACFAKLIAKCSATLLRNSGAISSRRLLPEQT